MSLELAWYLVVCVAVVAYVVLDGFDLGVGMLHLFTRKDENRRLMLNSIGPVWDGNEVWIIVVGGGLLAGFPDVYAVLCSVFYTPLMIFLAGIIFRAVAIEFRSKLTSMKWRHAWDIVFAVGSYLITFVLGVLLGNLVKGIPVDKTGNYYGTFWTFFTPYTLLLGITAIALFMMHGAIYLNMKVEGEFHKTTKRWTHRTIVFFIIAYILLTFGTVLFAPHMVDKMNQIPHLYFVGLALLFTIVMIPFMVKKHYDGWAFVFSSVSILLMFTLFGIGTYPIFIRSTIDTAVNSLTYMNSASSDLTLKILLIIAACGIPLVLGYGWWLYRIFRGKVKMDSSSY